MFNIGHEILQEKFLKPKLKDQGKNASFRKSGIFTGTRSSLTYSKNTQQRYANKANNYLNPIARKKIIETTEEIEENLVYKRNIKNPYPGKGNRSAVPHSVIQNNINNNKPYKPANGKVPTMLNTKWGQQEIQKKYRNIARLFK